MSEKTWNDLTADEKIENLHYNLTSLMDYTNMVSDRLRRSSIRIDELENRLNEQEQTQES